DPSFATWEQGVKDLREFRFHVVPSIAKDLQNPCADGLDDTFQVAAGLGDIVKLRREEGIALFQSLEFFQRQGVDLAQRVQILFGLLQTLSLSSAIEIIIRGVITQQIRNRDAELLRNLGLCLI